MRPEYWSLSRNVNRICEIDFFIFSNDEYMTFRVPRTRGGKIRSNFITHTHKSPSLSYMSSVLSIDRLLIQGPLAVLPAAAAAAVAVAAVASTPTLTMTMMLLAPSRKLLMLRKPPVGSPKVRRPCLTQSRILFSLDTFLLVSVNLLILLLLSLLIFSVLY